MKLSTVNLIFKNEHKLYVYFCKILGDSSPLPPLPIRDAFLQTRRLLPLPFKLPVKIHCHIDEPLHRTEPQSV